MLKNLKAIAGAAIIVATLATSPVQARQIGTAKTDRLVAQKLARAQTQAPYFWLVLGVGY